MTRIVFFCPHRHLSVASVSAVREKYWPLPLEEKNRFLVGQLRENYDIETGKFNFYVAVGENSALKVCQDAWRMVLGISNDKVQLVKTMMHNGNDVLPHGNIGVQ